MEANGADAAAAPAAGVADEDEELLRLDFPDFARSDLLQKAKKIVFGDLEADAPTCDVDGYKFIGRHEPSLGTQLMFELPKEPGVGRATYKGMCHHVIVFQLVSIPTSVCTGEPLESTGEWAAGVSGKIHKTSGPPRKPGPKKKRPAEAEAGEEAGAKTEGEGNASPAKKRAARVKAVAEEKGAGEGKGQGEGKGEGEEKEKEKLPKAKRVRINKKSTPLIREEGAQLQTNSVLSLGGGEEGEEGGGGRGGADPSGASEPEAAIPPPLTNLEE